MSYQSIPDQEADAQTLVTLLHLQNIAGKLEIRLNIVSEMCDLRNRKITEVARIDDFIISDNLISLLMSQLLETKELKGVFDNLFSADGTEIYLIFD